MQGNKKIKIKNSTSKVKLNRFTERVLMINLPTAGCLLLLVMIGELQPITAVITFGTIVMVSILIIIPFMEQLQSITDYSRSLVKSINEGKELPIYQGEVLGDEYSEIIEAINKLHNIWNTKNEAMSSNYISDSAILDILPDPLLLLGDKEEVVGANLMARNLFGDSVRTSKLQDLITSSDAFALIHKVIEGQSDKEQIEYKTDDKNAKYLFLKIERLPALAHGGARVALVFHDITEARKLEQMQADFVANASHELRTPLSVISGFIETLQGTAKNDEIAREKFLNIMAQQSLRMSKLIENLLSLSKIELNDTHSYDNINVKELLLGIILSMEPKLVSGNIKIVNLVRHSNLVYGNASEISQVFQNLIDNAIKYGKENSEIMITSKTLDDTKTGQYMLAISVNNQGDIIPSDQIPRICERFYRIDTEKTRNRSGSGLGLAIVKRIMERHNGEITISSDAETGTTFTVVFPIAKKPLSK